MSIRIYQVDSFTDKPFAGNPAGVCILDKPADESWMQNIAMEMNLSETSFLWPLESGYSLRWFTPELEVDLCGHATLAAAHILWEKGFLNKDEKAKFYTKSGLLTCKKDNEFIEMNFPSEPEVKVDIPEYLAEALNINPLYVGKNRFDYLVQIESEEGLRKLKPNFNLLEKIDCRGIIVTSSSKTDKYDFVSRFFAPKAGINEDPVTGSAHCCLVPFWHKITGKTEFNAYQASKRGGEISLKLVDNRVMLKGKAITVIEGAILF